VLTGLKDRLGDAHPLAATIDAALRTLATEETPAIASGLAVELAAPDFPVLREEQNLRGIYRSVVADFASPRDALTRLLGPVRPEPPGRRAEFPDDGAGQ